MLIEFEIYTEELYMLLIYSLNTLFSKIDVK